MKIEEKRMKNKNDILFDKSTGQRLFQPVTNNTDMTKYRNRNVFKYLYSLHSSRSRSRKDKENEFIIDKDLTPQVFSLLVNIYNLGR